MSATDVIAGELTYQVVDDLTASYGAIFTGALVDEITGGPIVSQPLLSTDFPKLSLRIAQGGLISGAAYAEQVFPQLSSTAYTLNVRISAQSYRDAILTVNVPIAATFPVETTPVIMRRTPVRLQGRVVRASDRAPLPGAVVASKSGTTPLLRDTVRSEHAAGAAVVSLSFMNTGPARQLIATSPSSSDRLALSDNTGLSPGDQLQIGAGGSAAIYEVSAVGPEPGLVVLTTALTATFAAGTSVQQVSPSAPSGNATLARGSDAGDGVLMLSASLSDVAIAILDGPLTEYHWLSAISDADGRYRANGIEGAKSLELLCSAVGFTPFDQPWMPQYGDSVNVVDFRLRP